MLGHDRAILLLHGEVSFSAIPHLEAVLDSVIALGIPSITVDLSDTAKADPDALDAIRRRESQVQSLIFDEENHRFQRILRDHGSNLEVTEWRSYDRLITDDTADAFLVFLDAEGLRVLRSRRHGGQCVGALGPGEVASVRRNGVGSQMAVVRRPNAKRRTQDIDASANQSGVRP
jgi:hypothetical protein